MINNKLTRTGIGYDVHRLSKDAKLIIGGISIKFSKGSLGHSDGDALIHSIVDALLGAACLGDIGDFFSSDNSKWKGVSSELFLKFSIQKLRSLGFEINNIDTNIIIQNPKLSKYKPNIISNLARILEIEKKQISVKAKTADKLGFIGRGDGWSCQAIATIYKK